eukprot:scaffold46651_cov35-Prasinocladus_malaysianus.AAC.2
MPSPASQQGQQHNAAPLPSQQPPMRQRGQPNQLLPGPYAMPSPQPTQPRASAPEPRQHNASKLGGQQPASAQVQNPQPGMYPGQQRDS